MERVQVGTYQRAAEALQLREPYSDDDLNAAAARYEADYGIPLVRPDEEDENGHPTSKFARRLAAFDFGSTGVVADPMVVKKELLSLLELAKKRGGLHRLAERERKAVHECQTALGLPLSDFAKSKAEARKPAQIAADAEAAYKSIQKRAAGFKERLEAVREMEDVATLQIFADRDPSDEVQLVAAKRLQEIEIAKVDVLELAREAVKKLD